VITAIAITPDSNHTGVTDFFGFTIAEDAGATAHIRFRKLVVTGTILASIKLQAGESAMIMFPDEMEASGGVYVQEVSGSIEGSLYDKS